MPRPISIPGSLEVRVLKALLASAMRGELFFRHPIEINHDNHYETVMSIGGQSFIVPKAARTTIELDIELLGELVFDDRDATPGQYEMTQRLIGELSAQDLDFDRDLANALGPMTDGPRIGNDR